MTSKTFSIARAAARLRRVVDARVRDDRALDERGDVPGWVMITVMTVAIVAAIWAVAAEQLTAMLTAALNSVGQG
jgi:hypothetical protein